MDATTAAPPIDTTAATTLADDDKYADKYSVYERYIDGTEYYLAAKVLVVASTRLAPVFVVDELARYVSTPPLVQ